MTYARIQNGTVMELFTPPTGVALAECFAAEVVAMFVDVTAVSPQPQPGWTATETNGAWTYAPPPGMTAAQLAAALQNQARAALADSDITIARCYEHAVAVPAEWQTYRAELRAIVAGGSTATTLPTKPAYPTGT